MKRQRWDSRLSKNVDSAPEVEAFLADILAVYKKHGMTLGHEDGHGAFLIQPFDQNNIDWIIDATDDRSHGDGDRG